MPRDEILPDAIEELYRVFASYRFTDMEGDVAFPGLCDPKPLLAKPLRLLPADAFDRFAWKAMTTWGNADDFRHFLPRMLELLATQDQELGLLEREFLFGKLHYGKWRTWPTAEIDAIERFLRSWWLSIIRSERDIATINKPKRDRHPNWYWHWVGAYDEASFFLHDLDFLHHPIEEELQAVWAGEIDANQSIGPIFNLAKIYIDKNDYDLDQLDEWYRQPTRSDALFKAWLEHQDQEPLASFFSEAHNNADQIMLNQ